MINCPECGHAVSSTATACPNCGHVLAGAGGTVRDPDHIHDHDHDRVVHDPDAVRRNRATDPGRRVGAGRWLAGLFFLALLVLIALWYFDIVNFV